jgi:hypothetical protein
MPCTDARLALDAADDLAGRQAALVARLEVDQHAARVEGRVGAVDADEGAQALDVGILEDRRGQRVLALDHGVEGDRLRRLGHGLDQAGVLHREEALRDDDIEHDRQHDGADGDQQGERLVAEHHDQASVVDADQAAEPAGTQRLGLGMRLRRRPLGVRRPLAQQLGAHHRHQGQRDDGRDQDGDRERDGELAEQAADDVAHEQQRDQHGDQRHGERHHGEGDLPAAAQRGLLGILAALDVAGDVLDHDDGVVDHEAGGDGERHDREVVEAEAREIHHRQGADERQRHREAGDQRRPPVAQEQEDHGHDQDHREAELDLHVAHRGADGGRAVGQHDDVERGRQRLAQLRQQALDAVDHLDDVGAGLAADVDDHRLGGVHPGGEAGCSPAPPPPWRRRGAGPARHCGRRRRRP